MPYESPRKIAAAIQTALFNASVKIKRGEKLTEAERKLCEEYPKVFTEYLKADDLDVYFNVSKSEKNQQLETNIPSQEQQKGIFNSRDIYPERSLLKEQTDSISISGKYLINDEKEKKYYTNVLDKGKSTNDIPIKENSFFEKYPVLVSGILILLLFALITIATSSRIGCECNDGTYSPAISSGACSYHGGVKHWTRKYWWN